MADDKVVKVFSTVNEEEMIVVKSLLEDAGIQYFVEGEDGRGIYGFTQGMFNEMHLFVNSDEEENVKKILEVMAEGIDVEEINRLADQEEGWEEDCGCQAREE